MLYAIICDYLANQTERYMNLIRQDLDIMQDDYVMNFDELRSAIEELREDRVAEGSHEPEQQQPQRDMPEPRRALTKNGVINFIQECLYRTHHEAVQTCTHIDRVYLKIENAYLTRLERDFSRRQAKFVSNRYHTSSPGQTLWNSNTLLWNNNTSLWNSSTLLWNSSTLL